MSGDLEGRVIVVTGATAGLGRAIAAACVAAGAMVAVTSRDLGRAQAAAEEIGGGANGFALGSETSQQAKDLVTQVMQHWNRLDGLVNNSGAAIDNYLTGVTDERWEEGIRVNLSAPFWLLRAATPVMKAAASGAVVNMTSQSGLRGNPGQATYGAAKGGLTALTLTAAKELGRFGIRVNAVSPSVYPTPMTSILDPEVRAAALRTHPLPREGRPEEVGDAVVFLLSDRSSYTTGQILHVDGGLHLV